MKKTIFDLPLFRTAVKSGDVKLPEMLLGYFLGPFGVFLLNAVLVGYINIYFTDVLGISGSFLVVFPMAASFLAVAVNIFLGTLVDRTRTAAGKARPFILLSAPLLLISGVLLFSLPAVMENKAVQMVSIILSYNLYHAVANTVFSAGNSLMVPLSTRNSDQRSQLSVFANMSMSAAVGGVGIVFPWILAIIGTSKPMWAAVMSVLAVVACVSALVEFYFTRERITE